MRKLRYGIMMIHGASSGRHGASSGRLHSVVKEKKKEVKATKVALIPKPQPRAVT